MPSKPAPQHAIDAVKQALTLEACSSATVGLLQQTLFCAPSSSLASVSVGSRSRTKAAAVKPLPRKKPAAAEKVTVSVETAPSLAERYRLAIEVVNSCLKVFSAAVKSPAATTTSRLQPALEPPESPRETAKTRKGGKLASATARPLQPRSANRNDTPATPASPQCGPLDYLAACCNAAISFIQSIEHERAPGVPDIPPLQIENVQYTVASKLLQLGMYGLAFKQLANLKPRLEEVMSRATDKESWVSKEEKNAVTSLLTKVQNRAQSKSGGKDSKAGVCATEEVDKLLEFSQVSPGSAAFPLVVSYQVALIRCIFGMKNPELIETLAPSLSCPHNPLVLIRMLAKSSISKAANHLTVLSQVILANTPSASPSIDSVALDSKVSCSPNTVLGLQMMAIESGVVKGSLQPDEKAKDPWSQFASFLAAYVRRTATSSVKRDRYITVRDSAERARRLVDGKGSTKPLPLDVYKMLSWSAAEAGLNKEAAKWTEEWLRILESENDPANSALVVLCKVRLATLAFKGSVPRNADNISSEPDAVQKLEQKAREAAEGLANVARGRKQDLDFVSQEVSALRRSTLGLLQVLLREFQIDAEQERKQDAKTTETKQRLKRICDGITRSIITFSRKYMAMKVSEDDRARARPILLGAIDTALTACWRGFDVHSLTAWNELELLLSECGSAVALLESDGQGCVDPAYYQKVSRAYYQIHVLYLAKAGAEKESVRALRRSIAALDGRSPKECESAHLANKWERLGSIFMGANAYQQAQEAFVSAMQAYSDTGVFKRLGERASRGESLSNIIDSPDRDAQSVGRALASLVQIANRNKDEVAADLRFEYHGITASARGLLLEWAFRITTGVIEKGTLVRILGERLLDIYPIEEFPVRRARVLSKLLGMTVDRAGLLNRDEVTSLVEDIVDWAADVTPLYLGYDSDLSKYKDGAVASCLVGLAFCHWQDESPRPDLMRKALAAWSSILSASADWTAIAQRIESPDETLRRLGMIVEFCDMKGEVELKVAALKLLIGLRELEVPYNYETLVNAHTILGLQYLRLGYSGKAGISLATAQGILKKEPTRVSTVIQLQLNLAYTEYLVNIGNVDKGADYAEAASEIIESDHELSQARESGAKVSKRIIINRAVADAAYVTSLLAFEKGNVNESLVNARRSLRLNQRAWAGLESLSKDIPLSGFTKNNEKHMSLAEFLTEDMGGLPLNAPQKPKAYSTTYDALNTPSLWSLVSALYLAALQTANVYRHLGMSRQATFFIEQANKTAEAVNASSLIIRTKIMLADLEVRCGYVENGEEVLADLEKAQLQGLGAIEYELALANLERSASNFEAEREAYERAENNIDQLVEVKAIEGLGNLVVDETDLTDLMTRVQIEDPKPRRPKTPVRSRGRAAITAVVSKLSSPKRQSASLATVAAECSALVRQRAQIQRLKAHSYAFSGQFKEAIELLEAAAKIPSGLHGSISQGLVEANQLLHKALSLASSDPVFSVLQDSTISLPSVAITSVELDTSRGSPAKKGSRRAVASAKQAKAFVEVLQQARDRIFKVHDRAVKMGSASVVNSVASSLARTVVLLSAMTSARGRGPEHPLFASYTLELNKGQAMLRERIAAQTDKLMSTMKEDLSWPQIEDARAQLASIDSTPFDFVSFREEYVDIIPPQWIVVSMSLSENQDELYVSRFRAGENQLMVRLPLTRHNSRDVESEVFEYGDGLSELQEIITAANQTTHEAKTMTDKKNRAQWWARREQLDGELKVLLENIEHMWLGGFRGILCQYSRNLNLFSRFRASFSKIMAKYLPSRRKKAKGTVEIDYRILELFIALGNPEGQDLEEALLDLLYFVVDILQFHGEGNAYDEIDMERMVIDITDALTSYHEEAAVHPEESQTDVDHTILILDKSLQQFPWESLPCLRGTSVSRLPSLAALRERILAMQRSRPYQPRPGHYMSRESGSYVLNPASDLTNTQALFEDDLAALPGSWDRIVNRAPSADEFAQALEKRDVFLYFGHGSGGHYIPTKRLQRLERCAISCLMGCSSGTMKAAGEFDSYGTPATYLLAGCPAVLANLWDVTDRDIDKFSKEVFESWGLIGAEGKGKEKGKARSAKREGGGKSLVEAVAGAREKCKMAYLNGAAPVVYGIPAYFA